MKYALVFILAIFATQCSADFVNTLLNAQNAYRTVLNLSPFTWSEDLATSAQAWANHLASIGSLVHSGESGVGENLAYISGTYAGVNDGLNSTSTDNSDNTDTTANTVAAAPAATTTDNANTDSTNTDNSNTGNASTDNSNTDNTNTDASNTDNTSADASTVNNNNNGGFLASDPAEEAQPAESSQAQDNSQSSTPSTASAEPSTPSTASAEPSTPSTASAEPSTPSTASTEPSTASTEPRTHWSKTKTDHFGAVQTFSGDGGNSDGRLLSNNGRRLSESDDSDADLVKLVGLWGAEKQYFVYGTFPDVSSTGNWEDVGHYTQLVWANTKQVGCGIANGDGNIYLVCQYYEAGNWDGETPY